MRVRMIDVQKSFGQNEVVKNLSLDIADGELLVLLGESGCGKTTALRMVAGLETVSGGTIEIGDRDVTNVLPKYRNVAMVFQSYALYPHMTVAKNIGYPLKLRGTPAAELDAAVRVAAEKVHLEDLLHRYPRQLSGGQRQRVALARAMVRTPSVFLMDEPLSNLDAKLRIAMRVELKRLQSELGVTTIYVTHDQVEAMTLAHRVAVMDEGVLQQVAPPKEIYDDPANLFVARFIGAPAMNIVEGRGGGRQVYRAGRRGAALRRRAQRLSLPRLQAGGRHPRAGRECDAADAHLLYRNDRQRDDRDLSSRRAAGGGARRQGLRGHDGHGGGHQSGSCQGQALRQGHRHEGPSLKLDGREPPARRPSQAGDGWSIIAPVRGSVSTAARVPIAATDITANSAPKPQLA